MWKAPFTLNITNTEPDISYCVQMLNLSNGNVLTSVCSIVVTGFHYTLKSNDFCYKNHLRVTVTPVNEAGYGIADSVIIRCKL